MKKVPIDQLPGVTNEATRMFRGVPVVSDNEVEVRTDVVAYQRNEDKILVEVADYIASTYSAHYSGKVQVTDIWDTAGIAHEAYQSNIIKYASRAGKKGSAADARKDVMKIIHYSVLLLNEMDKD